MGQPAWPTPLPPIHPTMWPGTLDASLIVASVGRTHPELHRRLTSTGKTRRLSVALLVAFTLAASACQRQDWGPLAVIPAPDSQTAAAIDGPVHVTENCVLLEEPESEVLLVWPVDRVTWVAQSETLVWHNVDGDPVVTLTDGDQVVLGGSSAVRAGQYRLSTGGGKSDGCQPSGTAPCPTRRGVDRQRTPRRSAHGSRTVAASGEQTPIT